MVEPEILAYYERNDERDRLTSGARRIEYLRVQDLLDRCLPAPPASILDVGGGAGVHAIPLAAAGYQVHLVDAVPLLVAQAAEASARAAAPLASATVGDARSLAAADATIDATLLLGPLYHLTSRRDRLAALAEARRVTRPGGVVIALALSRFYPLFEALVNNTAQPVDETVRFLADGQHRNQTGDVAGFTTSYFHHPDELASEIGAAGLRMEHLAAASGIVKLLLPELGQRLDDEERREHLMSLLRFLETEPSILGMSQNFVAVARVPAEPGPAGA
jgi:ubiquinone/menaquinone biosynthesis C-methylase UbiE